MHLLLQAASEDELRYALGLSSYTTGKGKVDMKETHMRPIEVFMCSVVRTPCDQCCRLAVRAADNSKPTSCINQRQNNHRVSRKRAVKSTDGLSGHVRRSAAWVTAMASAGWRSTSSKLRVGDQSVHHSSGRSCSFQSLRAEVGFNRPSSCETAVLSGPFGHFGSLCRGLK